MLDEGNVNLFVLWTEAQDKMFVWDLRGENKPPWGHAFICVCVYAHAQVSSSCSTSKIVSLLIYMLLL